MRKHSSTSYVDVARLFSRLRCDLRSRSGLALDRDREAAWSGERARERRGDNAMVPSRSVFQTCLGRARGAWLRGILALKWHRRCSRAVSTRYRYGIQHSLSSFFLSFSFSLFPFTFSATPGYTRNRSNSRLYFSGYASKNCKFILSLIKIWHRYLHLSILNQWY